MEKKSEPKSTGPADYIRFTHPVPPGINIKKEPVYEFKLVTDDIRYKVDSIYVKDHAVVIKVNNQTISIPESNVAFARLIE